MGNQFDSSLVQLEQKYMCNVRLSESEVKLVADVGAQLKANIKRGTKYAAAMKVWFKL